MRLWSQINLGRFLNYNLRYRKTGLITDSKYPILIMKTNLTSIHNNLYAKASLNPSP